MYQPVGIGRHRSIFFHFIKTPLSSYTANTYIKSFKIVFQKTSTSLLYDRGTFIYRRTRAMVWLQIDGQEVWLNELLVEHGYARARLDFRFSHEAKLAFALAEWEARKNRRNLWSVEGIEGRQ